MLKLGLSTVLFIFILLIKYFNGKPVHNYNCANLLNN